nr:MAG TPA: hypothetical protein [Caudoviricetes sp.]
MNFIFIKIVSNTDMCVVHIKVKFFQLYIINIEELY